MKMPPTTEPTAVEISKALFLTASTSKDPYARYHCKQTIDKLGVFPPSGGGGAHGALLSVSNHAVRSELSDEEIYILLREVVHGPRYIPDGEIWQAVERARCDLEEVDDEEESFSTEGQPKRSVRLNPKVQLVQKEALSAETKSRLLAQRDEWIEQGMGTTEADIKKRSSVGIKGGKAEHAARVIEELYEPDELIFMGKRSLAGLLNRTIRRAKDWCQHFRSGGYIPELMIINPLTGTEAPTKSGDKMTYRGDACVKTYKYAVVEFDDLTLEEQLAFWSQCPLPIVALNYSGGKSYHAWVKVDDVATAEQWDLVVKEQLYEQMLVPMGVDAMCKNPARLTRVCGHKRLDKNKFQRCIFLAPEGRSISNDK